MKQLILRRKARRYVLPGQIVLADATDIVSDLVIGLQVIRLLYQNSVADSIKRAIIITLQTISVKV